MALEKTVETVKEALEKAPKRNFLESIEISVNLKDVDLTNPKNRLTEEILLPKGRGKELKIAVFGGPEMKTKAEGVADRFIAANQIEELAEEKSKTKKMVNETDFFIAEAPLMAVVGKNLGVILGPRGKMPRPLPPGADPSAIIANLKKTVKVRTKDRRTFHVAVGTTSMTPEDIAANIEAVLTRVKSKLERGAMNVHTAYVKTSMGPSIRLEVK